MTTPPLPAPKTSGMAIAAFVLAFVFPPLGFILAIVALVQINNSNGRLTGQVWAILGIVMPIFSMAIIGILAAIAIPNFIRYQLRAKTSEAKVNIGAIRTGMMSFKSDFGVYPSLEAQPAPSDVGLEKLLWANPSCSSSCSPEAPSECRVFDCIGFRAEGPTHYSYACQASADGEDFTCGAVADLDGDGQRGFFVFGTNSKGGYNIVVPPPTSLGVPCADAPSGEIYDCAPGDF